MELPTLKVERLYRQISNLIVSYIRDGRFKVGENVKATPSEAGVQSLILAPFPT